MYIINLASDSFIDESPGVSWWRKPNSCAPFNHHLMFSFPGQSSIFQLGDESCHLLSVRYDVLEIKSTNRTHTHTHTQPFNGTMDY